MEQTLGGLMLFSTGGRGSMKRPWALFIFGLVTSVINVVDNNTIDHPDNYLPRRAILQ
jgi:hypothetical protein|tara:strand:- start:1800 stop:1973 length:174 start_codon:yes stop_codon:yes gene_type:complete